MVERRYPFIDYGDDQAVADYAASLPPRLPVAPPTISDEQLTMQQLNRDNAPLEWFPAVKESVGKLGSPLASGQEVYNRLTGSGGQERYQTWPEQLVRSGFALPADVYSGRLPTRDPLTGRTSQEVIERAQDLSGLMGGGSVAGVGARGVEPNTLGVVPVPKAKSLNIQRSVPSETLKMAAENTPGASIDAEGDLIVNVGRKQQPNQEMSESVRGGVFYLPAGDRNFRHYGTAKSYYGGQQKIEGETAFLNPLTVKGATGGKAPEAAYTQLMGKDGFEKLNRDVMDIVHAGWMRKKDPGAFDELVQRFFNTHAPELADLAGHILEHSTQGNQLRYALQEAAIGSAVRNAGHDGIIGYSTKRGADRGKPFISEIFDVREDRYLSPSGEYSLHPQFLSDTSANAPISALAKPVFYSALEHAVGNSKMTKADAEQWLGYLRNQPGVKQEELDFVLHDLPKGQITKNELEQYVQQHKVELKEINRQEVDENSPEFINGVAELKRDYPHMPRAEAEDIMLNRLSGVGEPKYSQWQLPGGENYREMLLTLPENKNFGVKNADGKYRLFDYKENDFVRTPDGRVRTGFDNEVSAQEAANGLNATSGRNPMGNFQSSHWDEPNVLAHIRTNERDIPGVGNSLHVEEIQSDWHQKGRKEGYKGEAAALQPKFDAIEKKILDSNDEAIMSHPELKDALKMAIDKKIITADEAKAYERYSNIIAHGTTGGVPDAPFKNSWTDLALKRIIVQAAREGKNAISWTPGEAQTARYDLSKQIDKLHVIKTDRGYLIGPERNGQEVPVNNGKPILANQLADYVGKELADKIINTKNYQDGHLHTLENVDLKIGGEGMKAYYNKMMVDKLNAITKKFGGKVETNVGEIKKAGPEEVKRLAKTLYETFDRRGGEPLFDELSDRMKQFYYDKAREKAYLADNPVPPMHVLRITPELRDAALNKGFSLFADTGKVGAPLAALSRIEHNPFKLGEIEKQHGVKLEPVEHNPFTTDAYHGAPKPFVGSEIKTPELFSTPNPQLAGGAATPLQGGYARSNRPASEATGNAVMPLKLDTSNYHEIDARGKSWQAINQQAIFEANQLNKSGIVVKNVVDSPDAQNRTPQTVYITLDPSTVRSKFAKFDPAKYGENGLLKADSGKVGASLAALSKEWEGKGVRNNIAQQSDAVGGHIKLHDLVVPKENRGQGIGSEFMNDLTKLADEAGKKVVLTAAKDYGATSLDRLKKFYKQFGFVENKGRNKDFRISDNMYRDPKTNVSELLKASGLPIYMDKDGNRLLPTHTQAEYEHLGGEGAAKAAEWLAFSQNYPKINAPLTAAWIAQWPMMAHLLKEDINRQLKNGVEPSAIKFDKGFIGNMFGVIGSLNKKFGNKTLVPHEGNPFSTASK